MFKVADHVVSWFAPQLSFAAEMSESLVGRMADCTEQRKLCGRRQNYHGFHVAAIDKLSREGAGVIFVARRICPCSASTLL
jgi:hypothetical protein